MQMAIVVICPSMSAEDAWHLAFGPPILSDHWNLRPQPCLAVEAHARSQSLALMRPILDTPVTGNCCFKCTTEN